MVGEVGFSEVRPPLLLVLHMMLKWAFWDDVYIPIFLLDSLKGYIL